VGKRLKNLLIFLAARGMLALVRLLPFSASLAFGRALGGLAFRLARRVRADTLAHLAIAFPEKAEPERRALGRAAFAHFGMAAAEWANAHKLPDVRTYAEVEPASRHLLEGLLSRGRGLVYVTAHAGHWELMALSLARHGFPVHTIGKRSYDPRFTRLIERFRDQGPVHTLWRGEPQLFERMAEVLKRRGIMGLLIDQDTRVPGVHVPFFGKLAFTPVAAALLARQTGAPVVTGFCHRRDRGGYWIVVSEFKPCDDEFLERAVAADTAAMTRRIEEHVRAHPGEWVWMHRRWKTRPPEEGTA
jgi:KDO2-lipid IV(A) lauroyltransferase